MMRTIQATVTIAMRAYNDNDVPFYPYLNMLDMNIKKGTGRLHMPIHNKKSVPLLSEDITVRFL
ncbi:hypothetical protein ACE3MZ_07150 [Paenibacillus sp. WLX1005]|uniref:hypothetical protein n=1 Tax=Paenibacillus sp. WLX1005 TaxID=3243766 RepID=UPI003983ED3F